MHHKGRVEGLIMLKELQQRCFIADVAEPTEDRTREVKITFDEYVYEDDTTECTNEDFELDGEYTDYNSLVQLFGKRAVDAFIVRAQQNAR